MKLQRPYVPLSVRVQVAERQLAEVKKTRPWQADYVSLKADKLRLKYLLSELFGPVQCELHHRPALCNREKLQWRSGNFGGYVPDANDPDYLVYLPADEHDIETRVRGQHGDYSDLAKARKRKRSAKKEARQAIKATCPRGLHGLPCTCKPWPKRKWPKRKFPKNVDTRWRVK